MIAPKARRNFFDNFIKDKNLVYQFSKKNQGGGSLSHFLVFRAPLKGREGSVSLSLYRLPAPRALSFKKAAFG